MMSKDKKNSADGQEEKELEAYSLDEFEDEQEKKRKKFVLQHKHRRIIGITFTICTTVFLAIFAGVFLALIESGKSFGDLAAATAHIFQRNGNEVQEAFAEGDAAVSEDALVPSESGNEASTSDNTAVAEDAGMNGAGDTVSDAAASDATTAEDANAATVSENTTVSDNETISENEYPKEFQLVDESYFDDALFIGDSRMEGFGLHSGLNATFYAATGLQLHKIDTYKVVRTEDGKKPIFDVIQPGMFKKVYIKVGLNELGWGTDAMFLQEYTELINRIRELEPDAIIYIHGLIHVTAAKSASDPVHTNDLINARNEMLKNFAIVQQAYYVDINEVVSDENGALLPDLTGDGVHLKAQYMELWKNYLMAHAIVE
jgi:hypothetical protein